MVRPRIQLKKLEGELSREHYYLQNKSIVSKKVREISVLTATDVFFLAFSPSGIPTLHLGQYSNLLNIMKRFSLIPYADREKRRYDNLQTMKATYEKEGYNIDVQILYEAWKSKKVEDMRQNLDELKKELADLKQRKSYWENLQNVTSIEKIKEMEESLQKSLQRVRQRKKEIQEQQMMASHIPIDEPIIESFKYYIPEMLNGNDELLAHYSNTVTSEYQSLTSGNHLHIGPSQTN